MASRRNQRRSMCAGKVAYRDSGNATMRIATMCRSGSSNLHTYRCPFCKAYHIGHYKDREGWKPDRHGGRTIGS